MTTETLSQVTNLLAIVTAPPIETSTIRHVEVLALQPQVLMVVVITSTGGVTKRLFTFAQPVDTGLADWAASYLNERLVGLGLGARILHQRLHDPELSGTEAAFLEALAPVFTELEESAQATLYVDGTARLLTDGPDGRRLRAQPADGHARAPRHAAGDPALGAAAGTASRCASAPRTRPRLCARWPWWPPATACPSAPWARCR